MSTAHQLPTLEPGDHLDQPTFHKRYEAMPEDFRAELIEGVVYMPSPAKNPHAGIHGDVAGWIYTYTLSTPGSNCLIDPSIILGPQDEPQPDVALIILPDSGGQVRYEDAYVVGPPEFIVEVASSSVSLDLNAKKRAYEKAGVCEYLVINLRDQRIHWFALCESKYQELAPDEEGIFHSEVFPGLWLDGQALLRRDIARVNEVLQQGLATPEHAEFVNKLSQ